MKAVVFAAGLGKRLRPLTSFRPKHLLPLVDKPVLIRVLEALLNNGIVNVGMTVAYMDESIKRVVEQERLPMNITYIPQKVLLGTAHALYVCKDFLEGEDSFLTIYGDITITEDVVGRLLSSFSKGSCDGVMLAVKVKDASSFGMLKEKDGILECVIEKPEGKAAEAYVNAGAYILPSESVNYFSKIKPSARGEYELTDILNLLVEDGYKIHVLKVSDSLWFDIGRAWDLLDANAAFLEYLSSKHNYSPRNGKFLRPGAYVETENGAKLFGPCFLGENVKLGKGSSVLPYTVVLDGALVGDGVMLGNSLILENVTIGDGSVIFYSVVGEGALLGAGCTTRYRAVGQETVKAMVSGKLVDTGRREFGAVISPYSRVPAGTVLEPGEVYWQEG
ncbi:MAG: sugar phosphate nucleotidyltransferase [Nitrososphaerota archaeon]